MSDEYGDPDCWAELLAKEMKSNNDSFENVAGIQPEKIDLDKKFDPSLGSEEGEPFLLWTKKYVYFPVCYDGSEWVGSVPRNPQNTVLKHFGGG